MSLPSSKSNDLLIANKATSSASNSHTKGNQTGQGAWTCEQSSKNFCITPATPSCIESASLI
uniref:Uncharacterized protein n=1 Tax=uncultured marine virus TaxID=186617 RepID=A0A0F7LB05_9VIRU|nr:hypothetical protein [uncultured marine virus]